MIALKEKGAVAVSAAHEWLDRVCGKAPQPIVGEDGGAPINIGAPALVEALRRYVDHGDDDEEGAAAGGHATDVLRASSPS
jgi:hypothetical protein